MPRSVHGRPCPAGQSSCDGICFDLQANPLSCGSCNFLCATGASCVAGTCACRGGQVACGAGCCAGNGCCGSGCQTAHSNGLGQSTFDCGALNAWSRATALAAAAAWAPTGGTDYDLPAGLCLARQTSTACATWCYAGTFAGRVILNDVGTNCLVPTTLSPTWN